jgi:hypothetical protein
MMTARHINKQSLLPRTGHFLEQYCIGVNQFFHGSLGDILGGANDAVMARLCLIAMGLLAESGNDRHD